MNIIAKLGGRKFVLTLVGAVVVFLKGIGVLAIEDDSIWQLLTALLGFVGIEGGADIISRWKDTNL